MYATSGTVSVGNYDGASSWGSVGIAGAIQAGIDISGSGSVGHAVGFFISTMSKSGTPTIGDARGLWIQNQNIGAANYGIYIESFSGGYPIYVAGGTSYFNGSLLLAAGWDIQFGDSGTHIIGVNGASGYIKLIANGTLVFQADGSGICVLRAPSSAPTDANLFSSSISPYLEEGTNELKFRAKYSGGTYTTFTVPNTLANGALVLLEQHTASSSASLDFTSAITSTYDEYLIEFLNLLPASGDYFVIQFSTNGGSTYDTTAANYITGWHYARINSAAGGDQIGSGAGITLTNGVGTTQPGMSGSVRLFNSASSVWRSCNLDLNFYDGTDYHRYAGGAFWKSTTAANALKIKCATGGVNIASGTVRIYGVAK
jgi:hypothetical protein